MHQAVRTVMAEDEYMYPLRPNYSLIIDCFHCKLTLNSHLEPQYIQEQVQHAETLIHFKYIKKKPGLSQEQHLFLLDFSLFIMTFNSLVKTMSFTDQRGSLA